jgi:hypothetical protein
MSVQTGRRIAGVLVMLLGAALIGYGAHHLMQNGNSSGEGLYTLSVFLLGPALAVAGSALGRLWGAFWPVMFAGLGVGLVTVSVNQDVNAVAKAFGPVAGSCLLAFALASVFGVVGKRLRAKTTAPAGGRRLRRDGHVPAAPSQRARPGHADPLIGGSADCRDDGDADLATVSSGARSRG